MSIWVHTLVKNEERYLWFAVSSVIDHVDRLLLWDTGSSDNTVKIAKELVRKFGEKIDFKEVGEVDINEFTSIRQEMLKATKADWLLIVDGDEVWWDEKIRKVVEIINRKGERLDSIVVGYYTLLGDIYHFESEKKGEYQIDGVRGHITIRAINRHIHGLNVSKPHGQQGFFDGHGNLIQNLPKTRRKFTVGKSYLHFTHIPRSSSVGRDAEVPKRKGKIRLEMGQSFPFDFYYPEVFFRSRPSLVASPWVLPPKSYKFRSILAKSAKDIKRRISTKSGYLWM
ncbi:glycosyltransferase family 2 protein [Candidatus Daviesbacteria bacterium]|nr:glycosyltransferase family 2 protein [Candidatus Daviesbacteria bacterium]